MSPILVVVLAVVAYFLPGLVAASRKHHQVNAIAVLNLLLGWTVLGWVGALVWACTRVINEPVAATPAPPPAPEARSVPQAAADTWTQLTPREPFECPKCRTQLGGLATTCYRCGADQ